MKIGDKVKYIKEIEVIEVDTVFDIVKLRTSNGGEFWAPDYEFILLSEDENVS